MPTITFITPPLIKPSEPGLSAAAAAAWFAAHGLETHHIDANIEWFQYALSPAALDQALIQCPKPTQAFQQAVRHGAGLTRLRQSATYQDKRHYSSAVNHLEQALHLIAKPWPAYRLRVGDVDVAGRQVHHSPDLWAVAQQSSPFDGYFLDVLLPRLAASAVSHVGLSLTFLNQAFPTFRLAWLLQKHLPHVVRCLGGPLVACWRATHGNLSAPVFSLFDHVLAQSGDAEMTTLALALGGQHPTALPMLAPSLQHADWPAYLAPVPTVPVAFSKGCYWRRCAFCPDYLHPNHQATHSKAMATWLLAVADRFPRGAMLHVTDSALSPALLDALATCIQKYRLPLRWHGFARMEASFADPDFMAHLKAGGCAMLQWGMECASDRLLTLMEKGLTAQQAGHVLHASANAGIRNHVYLLFGLPTETEADRHMTLAFLAQHASAIHDINASILNLPRQSPLHHHPERFGITQLQPFGQDTDLSLYLDFRCGNSHPRLEARRWLGTHLLRAPFLKHHLGYQKNPFKENHGCFFI